MKAARDNTGSAREGSTMARVDLGSWTVLIVLFSLLAATFVIVYLGWKLGSEADVPTSGYVAMVLGVIVSLAVGFGLMALVFYSSRKGYDEAPVLLIAPESDSDPSKDNPETK
jgi:cytochrome c oxidase assembly factor CtaG